MTTMTSKLAISITLAACALGFHAASLAHGSATAKHGGVVQTASDLGFELVATAQGAALYIDDHGKPLAPTGMSGKLTVLNGSDKSEAPLTVAGDRLEAKGVKLAKGAKVVASLTTSAQKAITVRFTLK